MTRRTLLRLLTACAVLGISTVAFAGGLSKKERKALEAQWMAAYPDQVWALKDLPAKTGMTMGIPWLGPIAEVTTDGVKIETSTVVSATYGSASTTWWGVRPYDTLKLVEAVYDDGNIALTFDGVDGSKGRDTKIDVIGAPTPEQAKASMDQIISTVDPCTLYGDWSDEVKQAIANRQVINGMTKRQVYLVVGEPESSTVQEVNGMKVEIWVPRQTAGMRFGYATSVDMTGYPPNLRFEDGKLVGVTTNSGGGVNLDD